MQKSDLKCVGLLSRMQDSIFETRECKGVLGSVLECEAGSIKMCLGVTGSAL